MANQIILRDYQTDYINGIRDVFASKLMCIILRADTGAGKTVMFSSIAQMVMNNGKRVLIVTDRKELHKQSGNTLSDFNVDFGILKAGQKHIPVNNVVVCMLETLKRRLQDKLHYLNFIQSFDLIILDEAHKSSFDKLFGFLAPHQRVIGATATPYRTGTMKPLSNFYQTIVDKITISELIKIGYLAKPISYGINSKMPKFKVKGQDYDTEQMAKYFGDKVQYTGIALNYKKYADGKKGLVFCVNIENSILVCEELKANGINARQIDSTRSKEYREETLKWLNDTPDAVLVNVDILTTGFDCPSVEVIILYRKTKSLVLFLQMVGRGGRVIKGVKDSFTILDFGNNIKEHGLWEENRSWSLDLAKIPKKKKNKDVAPVKECPKCNALLSTSARFCEFCGYSYPEPKKTKIEVVLERIQAREINKFAENCTIAELEEIRTIKNYKIGWVLFHFKSYADFKEYAAMKKYKKGWAERQWDMYKDKINTMAEMEN